MIEALADHASRETLGRLVVDAPNPTGPKHKMELIIEGLDLLAQEDDTRGFQARALFSELTGMRWSDEGRTWRR